MIIVIEGADQAGKKTQSQLLANALRKRKIKTKVFSFPDYSTPIGKEIKKYLIGKRKLPVQVVHCLLAANRWEKLKEIKDAISKNSVLIMNRYYQQFSNAFSLLAVCMLWKFFLKIHDFFRIDLVLFFYD